MVTVTMHIGGFGLASEVEITSQTVSACLTAEAMLRCKNNPENVNFSVCFYAFIGGEFVRCKYYLQDKLVVLEGKNQGKRCDVIYQLTEGFGK